MRMHSKAEQAHTDMHGRMHTHARARTHTSANVRGKHLREA